MSKENLNNLSFCVLVFLIFLFSLILFIASLKPFSLEMLSDTLNKTYYFLYNNVFNQIILGLIAIIVFSLGIYLIQKRKLLNTLSSSVTQKTSFG